MMLESGGVTAFLSLTAPISPVSPLSPVPQATHHALPGVRPRHRVKRKTSMVFDVKMSDDHVYVVVDDEDLVKSHLLLAVREEVDVLKASITKLVDKISVLERENEVLKANATPEVLAQLDTQPSQAPSPTPTPSQPASGVLQQQQPPASAP